jgi:hypothetical protein
MTYATFYTALRAFPSAAGPPTRACCRHSLGEPWDKNFLSGRPQAGYCHG